MAPPLLSIYVHIPFCRAKCLYCDFLSYAGVNCDFCAYVDAVCTHIAVAATDFVGYEVVTVFFGGGTPTVLATADLARILGVLRDNFAFSADICVSIEANPETVDTKALQALRRAGFNRISLGVQSFDDRHLQAIGRLHNAKRAADAVHEAAAAGFDDINIDLMFALPYQMLADFAKCLDMAVNLPITHISCYALTVEDGTPLAGNAELLENICNEEADRAMYHLAAQKLAQVGFEHYEISNWAKAGKTCRHNLGYWTGRQYAGFGAGAHSLLNKRRLANTSDVNGYISADFAQIVLEELDIKAEMAEFVILGLRLIDGISYDEFRRRFGCEMTDVFGETFARLQKQGLVAVGENGVCLTKAGLDLSNIVFAEFV